MFGFSMWEIGLIMAVALLVLGPKKLPELAKKLGETIREFRSATDSFKSTMDAEIHRPTQAPPAPNGQMTTSEPQALPEPELDAGQLGGQPTPEPEPEPELEKVQDGLSVMIPNGRQSPTSPETPTPRAGDAGRDTFEMDVDEDRERRHGRKCGNYLVFMTATVLLWPVYFLFFVFTLWAFWLLHNSITFVALVISAILPAVPHLDDALDDERSISAKRVEEGFGRRWAAREVAVYSHLLQHGGLTDEERASVFQAFLTTDVQV